jgi:putative endopeptidase
MKCTNAFFSIFVLICLNGQLKSQNAGINLSNIDPTVDPREDFYSFANGKWQKTFELPASDARYGSFNEINENNLVKIKKILDSALTIKTALPNTNAQRLRDFYSTGIDSIKADKLGMTPIQKQLDEISAVTSLDQIVKLKSRFEMIGIRLFFETGVSPDLKNSKKNRLGFSQGGLGLGDRDYYFSDKNEDIRKEYKRYITALLTLTGVSDSDARNQAETVFQFEMKLADKAFTRVQMRDLEKMYNPYTIKTLAELTPAIKWQTYFAEKKITHPDTIIVGMVDFMKQMSVLLERAPIENLKLYAKVHLLMEAAPYLTQLATDIHFNFRGRVMSGAKTMKPRWQRVNSSLNATLGDLVSQEFVKRHFPSQARQKINALIDNLILSYRERIASRDWMDAETKKQANKKLDLLIRKIGHPDKWKTYQGLAIGTNDYWTNICKATEWLVRDNLNDLKKPVDRSKWQMTAVTVNAYYDPTTNEITFPAAILQPPFYDANADDAANYGTMGSIIGHELTHGFDDMGSQFDAYGNMKMWWSPKDYQNFKDRTGAIVRQFDDYIAIDSMHVNGTMTQGENIADLGGLTMAYYAYKKSLKGKPSPVISGFTGEQRFFIAWAQGWKSKVRNEELKRLLTVDYHSPAYFRAFAPLTNMKEFHEAFNVKPGNKMYVPDEKRVEIW